MPGMDGIEATRRIKARWPAVRVLILTTFQDDESIHRALEAGADGYLLKSTPSSGMAQTAARARYRCIGCGRGGAEAARRRGAGAARRA